MRATATIAADADDAFRNKVGAHYNADVASFDAPGTVRVVVTLHPHRVNAQRLGVSLLATRLSGPPRSAPASMAVSSAT